MRTLYNILQRWSSATNDEVTYAKRILMPEDDPELIKLKVTEHPDLLNDRIYISWFDIDVYDRGTFIGYITVDTSAGDGNGIRYYLD